MGNCFGSASSVVNDRPPAAISAPPAKKQRKEQPYVTNQVEELGEKGDAHTLSEEKKNWQKKKEDANRRAAKLILEPQKWQTTGEIDLHGLYLDEALDATREFLKYWSKKASTRDTVLVITGAGHHSENNKAVIRPKVERLLQEQSLEYESVHGDGAFRVTLKPSQ
eukprot:CAMPEP_0116128324 /NCGR_PEP_ID=MMETSP0329-20121206/7303_1 /TAXON_ID=697910 /ORGANISM="Pseudo-nitzschia arenysensis, Strain B593" /LENGTH=165 /DNA_ID=CAMNT_0003622463 /DNA_START=72 /DNA_END=569 /DNA_ORIENTATION=-